MAENAVSSPPIVMSASCRVVEGAVSDGLHLSSSVSTVGLAREVPSMRPAAKMDAAHVVDVERCGTSARVALHQPLEAILDAEHVDATQDGANRGRADHAVDARRRAAGDPWRWCSATTRCFRSAACTTPRWRKDRAPHRRRHADRARRARPRPADLVLRPDRAPARLAAEPRRPSGDRGLRGDRARARQRPARPAGQPVARHGRSGRRIGAWRSSAGAASSPATTT